MLLLITNKCGMGCPHCLNNCGEDGEHMPEDVFDGAIDFIKSNKLPIMCVIVSGGEPTEHPGLVEMLGKLRSRLAKNHLGAPIQIILATNGMFLDRPDAMKYSDSILRTGSWIQITHDKRFYPKPLNQKSLSRLISMGGERAFLADKLEILGLYGRALKMRETPKMPVRVSPFCFNARTLFRSGLGFSDFIDNRERKSCKFCSVSIDWEGRVRVSESATCPAVGDVHDSPEKISSAIRALKCQQCFHMLMLPPHLRAAAGLDGLEPSAVLQ
jgi:hypothetical protein